MSENRISYIAIKKMNGAYFASYRSWGGRYVTDERIGYTPREAASAAVNLCLNHNALIIATDDIVDLIPNEFLFSK